MKNKLTISKIFRFISIIVFILGIFIGYDSGNKMIIIDNHVSYTFDFITAAFCWWIAFIIGMLFMGIARIIDLLELIENRELSNTSLKK